jgi:hypothetical protein
MLKFLLALVYFKMESINICMQTVINMCYRRHHAWTFMNLPVLPSYPVSSLVAVEFRWSNHPASRRLRTWHP